MTSYHRPHVIIKQNIYDKRIRNIASCTWSTHEGDTVRIFENLLHQIINPYEPIKDYASVFLLFDGWVCRNALVIHEREGYEDRTIISLKSKPDAVTEDETTFDEYERLVSLHSKTHVPLALFYAIRCAAQGFIPIEEYLDEVGVDSRVLEIEYMEREDAKAFQDRFLDLLAEGDSELIGLPFNECLDVFWDEIDQENVLSEMYTRVVEGAEYSTPIA